MQVGTFAAELLAVGIAFAVLYAFVSKFIVPESNPNHWWLAPFLAGVLGHIAFEVTGMNAYYARYKVREG